MGLFGKKRESSGPVWMRFLDGYSIEITTEVLPSGQRPRLAVSGYVVSPDGRRSRVLYEQVDDGEPVRVDVAPVVLAVLREA